MMESKNLLEIHSRMRADRTREETTFQILKDLVRPDTTDFSARRTYNQSVDARRKMFDGTAPWALSQLASGLHSYLTSPVDQWFNIGILNRPMDTIPADAKLWLEQVSGVIYNQFSNPSSSFNPASHELYTDLGGFGNAVVYEHLNMANRRLMFRAFPFADCFMDEDSDGLVSRVHREISWTVLQCKQEFGDLPPKLSKLPDTDKVCVIHAVYPRDNHNWTNRALKSRKFASVYHCKETDEDLWEGGYDWMPYHTPRWTKMAGDAYGRGPGLTVLPEIQMANQMSKTIIRAAQKIVDPPLDVPDDGFLAPLRLHPGGLNYSRPGSEEIRMIPTAQRVDIGEQQLEQRRDMIRKGFFVDWLVRPTKNERQTAQEITDDRNQMLSMLAPIVGRLHNEWTGPLIRLSYNLLLRAGGFFPEMPASMAGEKLDIFYTSPAAQAQHASKGGGLMAYIGQVTQLMPIMPEIVDTINIPNLSAELQDLTDVPRRVLNTPEQQAQKAQERQEQQQAAQMTEMLPAGAKAAKDLADAQATAGGV